MVNIGTKNLPLLLFILFLHYLISCDTKKANEHTNRLDKELATIDSLLRDPVFTEGMAKSLDSSYYIGIGQAPPPFVIMGDDTNIILKSERNEKIATKLAGFYALECGIGLLSARTNTTPVEWLEKIKNKAVDSDDILLLNRFANATWKAGQPFRDLSRITRPVFMVAGLLNQEEVDKDYFQIYHSAEKLLSSMQPVSKRPLQEQMELLRRLLQDTAYALEMASYLHSTGGDKARQDSEPFLTSHDDSTMIRKTAKQMKIATSIAGFYALECALNYFVTTKNELPSTILQSLVNNSMSQEEKLVFARFANATWKAGQPFRDLNRITRSTFTPFYFLTDADIEKDMVQVKAAGRRLLESLLRKTEFRNLKFEY